MSEMQAIYGNAASSENLKEQFYSASQSDGESVVDYSLRLECLLSSQINISQEEKNKMLCNKLWSGLQGFPSTFYWGGHNDPLHMNERR